MPDKKVPINIFDHFVIIGFRLRHNYLCESDMYYNLIIIHLFVLPYKILLDIRYSTLIFKPLLFNIAPMFSRMRFCEVILVLNFRRYFR